MTAPVAPMEARCEHCLDTGSLSKQIDGHLDCHYCDATEKRRKLRKHLVESGNYGFPDADSTAWAAYLFAQRQAAPVAIPDQTGDIFDLIREWAHLPEGQRGDVARRIIGHVNQTYMAGVRDTRELLDQAAAFQKPDGTCKRWCGDGECKEACVSPSATVAAPIAQPAQQVEVPECGACHGTGWVPRDADIGTEQECFSCDGSGEGEVPAPQLEAQQAGDVALKAARYDWLREDAETHYVAIHTEPGHMDALAGDELDAAIDRAMAKDKA